MSPELPHIVKNAKESVMELFFNSGVWDPIVEQRKHLVKIS